MNEKRKFVFIDLEMTGLDEKNDQILEAAILITDTELNPLHEGISYVIHQKDHVLETMNEWCKKAHTESGLVREVKTSTHDLAFVEQEFVKTIQQYAKEKSGILAGNSVWQDRLFLSRYMPQVLTQLHYRILDISTIKELATAWQSQLGKYKKKESHRALADVQESISELLFYKERMFSNR